MYYEGNFNEKQMQKNRIRKQDLREKVRQQGMSSFEKVGAIVLEGNGSVSIIKKEDVESKDALEGIVEKQE